MKINIIIDSTTDIKEELKKAFIMVPLTVRFGDKEYVDGVDITRKDFYEMLIESDVLPSTSQPSPAVFEELFREITDRGEGAVYLALASKLSGTYQSAMLAAEDFSDSIRVIDTENVAMGAGVLAEFALTLRDSGMELDELAEALEKEKRNIRFVALLDTLEYLKKGGRISAAVAFAGGLLSIKPVIQVSDGEVKILGKARGSKQGNNLLVQEIDRAGGIDFAKPLLLGYSGLSDHLLMKYVEDSRYLWEEHKEKLDMTCLGSIVGTHAGPGAIGVAFFAAK